MDALPTPAARGVRFAPLADGGRVAWAANGRGTRLVRVAHWMTHVDHDNRSVLWRPILERAGRIATLVRYDDAGCGLSADDRPSSQERFAQALEAVLQAGGHEPAALWGISSGGATALAHAVRHPERVQRLVLLGAYACGGAHQTPTPEQAQWHRTLEDLLRLGWGRRDHAVQQFFAAQMLPDATADQLHDLIEQQRLSCDAARAASIYRIAQQADVRALLPQVRVPTLVVHAEGDVIVPAVRARELAAEIPGARLVLLPSRNHVPLPGEAAFDLLFDAMAAFLAESAAPSLDFSARERELLGLVAQGLDNLQIAARLGLAEKTVRNGVSALYARLGVEGRPQAVARARDLGFG